MQLRSLFRAEHRRGFKLPRWAQRLASAGIVTTDHELARRQRLANIAAYALSLSAFSHLVINAVHEPQALMPLHIYNALVTLATLAVPQLHRFGPHVAAHALLAIVTPANLFAIWMLGLRSEIQVYFTLAGSIWFLFGIENWRAYLGWLALTIAVIVLAMLLAPERGLLAVEDTRLREMVGLQVMLNTTVVNAAVIFYALTLLGRAERELERQYARTEALLGKILPEPIAARLKWGTEQRIANRIDQATVLFADLADFTAAAHALPPEPVVGYLDGLVRAFDRLSAAHGVEKIKTIGDSYMAVGGLDGSGREGAVAVGRLALAMLEEQARHGSLGPHRVRLRIGIHIGTVIAGVIGDTRFTYDVWGDAVNIASRMQTSGAPDRVHVSQAYRDAVGNAFSFEQREPIEVKGIGLTSTYLMGAPAAQA